MKEIKTIDKLLIMPVYEGVMSLDEKIIPLWQIGLDKVDIKTFLEGAREYNKLIGKPAFLHIPFSPSDDIKSIESKVKEIELNYPVKCLLRYDLSEDEIIESHWYAETCK